MKLNGKKVLITGGAGFVGSHLAEALSARSCEVTVLDDLSNGDANNLAGAKAVGNVRHVNGTVEDEKILNQLIVEEEPEAVFHLAALNLLRSVENPERDLGVNCLGTLRILNAIRRAEKKPVLVFSSTGSVYGEPRYNPQDEEHPLDPVSPYGISKLAAEKYVLLWNKLYGVPAVALRYYNVYGPRQVYGPKGGVIGIFLSKILQNEAPFIEGDGHQERCFTYVSDVVQANILAAENRAAWGDVYNIGTTEITTVRELCEMALKLCKSNLKPQFTVPRVGDVRSFQPELTRAAEKLKYLPQVKLADGLVRTKEWIETVLT